MPLSGPTDLNTMVDQLRIGYWIWADADNPDDRFWPNFNPGNPTTITFNTDGLPVEARTLAELAFNSWHEVANINFVFTSDPAAADIHFSSNAGESSHFVPELFFDALSNQTWITDVRINIQPGFNGNPSDGIYSAYFYTLIHEIGHALGLGHGGNYDTGNINSYYDTNQTLFANDTWQYTIMSYNDQSRYDGGTATIPINPAMADILAIQRVYGAAPTTNSGDTVYGSGATAGLVYNFATLGGAASFTIYDTGGNDALSGSTFSANQTIDLRAGNWSSIGGRVHNIGIYLTTVIENAAGGSGHDTLIGNDVDNRLTGNGGNDTLNGGLGADILDGGDGIDTATYINSTSGVNAFLNAPQINNGGDAAGDSFSSIENMIGSAFNDILSGNTGDNTLNGGSGEDFINGTGGNDVLIGGLGNDILGSGPGHDAMFGNSGRDTASYELGGAVTVDLVDPGQNTGEAVGDTYSSVENLRGSGLNDILRGNDGVNDIHGFGGAIDRLFGRGGNDVLTAFGGSDFLDGGTGADTMAGGAGDDTYTVDNAGDSVVENSGEGSDQVNSSVSFSLSGKSIERLILTGTGNINGTGSSFGNTLVGNSGNNVLNGGLGADTMAGGTGNDTYVVDNAGDTVTEASGQGTDLVRSSVSFSLLGQSLENLTLTGSGNINGTGSQYGNILTGNTGHNILDGGAGADTMTGGAGNDTYVVDNAGDTVTEASGQGTDLVRSSVSFSLLGQSLEKLTLTGSGNINGTGTQYGNTIIGNGGNNVLDGGAGTDVLTGLGGSDTFVFDTLLVASNIDTITDFNVASDTIRLENAIFGAIIGTGTLTAGQFVANTSGTAQDGTDRIVYETDTGKLFYDSNGSAAGGAVQFAKLSAGLALTNADFVVV